MIAVTTSTITVITGCTESGLAPLTTGAPPAPSSTSPSSANHLVPVPDFSDSLREPTVWKGRDQILFDASNGGSDVYAVNLDGSGLMRLTNDPAPEFDAMWSPDGKRITYRSERDGNSEIYVMNADGSHQLNLTNNPASDYSPAWSPDGSKIAFGSDRVGGTSTDIYMMNADGTNVRRLTRRPAIEEYPTWSPDGAHIAFMSATVEPNAMSPWGIWVVSADGSGLHELPSNSDSASDRLPAWSPDGAEIAFSSGLEGSHRYDIYVMNGDGSDRRRVTREGGDSPAWSPDGDRIAYSWGSIFLMNSDGSGPQRLRIDLAELAFPDWRPSQ